MVHKDRGNSTLNLQCTPHPTTTLINFLPFLRVYWPLLGVLEAMFDEDLKTHCKLISPLDAFPGISS